MKILDCKPGEWIDGQHARMRAHHVTAVAAAGDFDITGFSLAVQRFNRSAWREVPAGHGRIIDFSIKRSEGDRLDIAFTILESSIHADDPYVVMWQDGAWRPVEGHTHRTVFGESEWLDVLPR